MSHGGPSTQILSKTQTKRRNITIRPILNGFICDVGCQTVAFNSVEHLLEELGRYLRNPVDTEESYLKNAVNKNVNRGPVPDRTVSEGPTTCGGQDPVPTPASIAGAIRRDF